MLSLCAPFNRWHFFFPALSFDDCPAIYWFHNGHSLPLCCFGVVICTVHCCAAAVAVLKFSMNNSSLRFWHRAYFCHLIGHDWYFKSLFLVFTFAVVVQSVGNVKWSTEKSLLCCKTLSSGENWLTDQTLNFSPTLTYSRIEMRHFQYCPTFTTIDVISILTFCPCWLECFLRSYSPLHLISLDFACLLF